uniref:Uncharacterized protein n=1 Tax=Caenorhabditis japonica TaxID=281687 RepID=A0A8R1ISK3_CAEJA
MHFFSTVAALGVGYWIGKRYSGDFTVCRLPIDPAKPDTKEFLVRIEKKETCERPFGFWCHHHHHQDVHIKNVEEENKN